MENLEAARTLLGMLKVCTGEVKSRTDKKLQSGPTVLALHSLIRSLPHSLPHSLPPSRPSASYLQTKALGTDKAWRTILEGALLEARVGEWAGDCTGG